MASEQSFIEITPMEQVDIKEEESTEDSTEVLVAETDVKEEPKYEDVETEDFLTLKMEEGKPINFNLRWTRLCIPKPGPNTLGRNETQSNSLSLFYDLL